tara:strand:+ start:1209 stop:2375 length:1167 start_codon:yes stop_codon:yes gene_type:complete
MINKVKSNYIYLIFLIPLFPHYETNLSNIHFDDIPIILYLISFMFFVNKKEVFQELKNFLPLFVFITYLLFQNLLIYSETINTEVFRYIFYLLIFIHISQLKKENFNFKKAPMLLFYFFATFSIFSYFLKLDFGTDSYNYWNIGLNLNEWGFTPGRVNGLQAGGPNSFGDLICIFGLYTLVNTKNSYKPAVIICAIVACFFTYSRSSLLVLIFFIVVYIFSQSDWKKNLGVVLLSLLVISNFGFVDRFSSERETEGIQDRIQMQTATAGFLSNSEPLELAFGNGFNNIGVVNDKVGDIEEFNEELRVTGPHNSYLFLILKYGIIGTVVYFFIFLKLIKKIFSVNLKTLVTSSSILSILAFLTLGLASDLLHNHTVVWFLYYLLCDVNE